MDEDCCAYIAGGEPSDELVRVRDAYLNTPWDEIHGEGVHRDASRVLSHAPPTQTAVMAATVRSSQNLTVYNGLDGPGRKRFHKDFDSMRTLASVGKRILRDALGRKITAGNVVQWMYRIGSMGMGDFTDYKKFIYGPTSIHKLTDMPTDTQLVKVDFSSKLLNDGDLITVPTPTLALMDAAINGDSDEVVDPGDFVYGVAGRGAAKYENICCMSF